MRKDSAPDRKAQALALTAELIADAAKQSAKIANGLRGEVSASIDGTVYRVVCANNRTTCYVGGHRQSRADFVAQLEYDLIQEEKRLDAVLARPAEIFTAAPDEGFDAEDAAEVERERSASIAADIEASRQRTLASLAELDAARAEAAQGDADKIAAFRTAVERAGFGAVELVIGVPAAGKLELARDAAHRQQTPGIVAGYLAQAQSHFDAQAGDGSQGLYAALVQQSEAFVLSASTVDGVRRHGSPEAYLADHGAATFCHPHDFYDSLSCMHVGEYLATEVNPIEHADLIARIDREYGIH